MLAIKSPAATLTHVVLMEQFMKFLLQIKFEPCFIYTVRKFAVRAAFASLIRMFF